MKNIRWAVRAALIIGVAASVGANVLHAQPHPISQAIAAWPPIALLLTVEFISRVPVHRRLLAAARLIATATIAGIAAWVSYWHMAGVAARYGETGLSAYLLPVSVDGLIVVASISLVELSARLHLERSDPPATTPVPPQARSAPPAAETLAAGRAGNTPITPANATPVDGTVLGEPPPADPADPGSGDQPEQGADHDPTWHDEPVTDEPPDDDGPDTDDESQRGDDVGDHEGPGDDGRQRRPRGATRKAVVDAYLKDPTKHPTTLAEEVGTSERTVRRYLEEFRASAGTDSPNGTNGAKPAHNGSPR
nr:DUF2637 domain-containing protein [Actinoplanes sp. ATCC 53533]